MFVCPLDCPDPVREYFQGGGYKGYKTKKHVVSDTFLKVKSLLFSTKSTPKNDNKMKELKLKMTQLQGKLQSLVASNRVMKARIEELALKNEQKVKMINFILFQIKMGFFFSRMTFH